MTENRLQEKIIGYLKKCGILARSIEYKGRRGCPDVVSMANGKTVWFEVKQPKGTFQPGQEREHKRMQAAGSTVYVVRSLIEVKDIVEREYPGRRPGIDS